MSPLKLKKTQEAFYQAVFDPKPHAIPFIRSNDASQRFHIYRKNIFENLRQALSITYPGVWKLLGKACADSTADVFCASEDNRPQSACLDDWGDTFPDFLGAQAALKHLPYLQDYAMYEKLQHQTYCAEEMPALKATDLQSLQHTISEDHASISFSFLPSVLLFCSDFPIQDIEQIAENPDTPEIPLQHSKSYLIIVKPEHQILKFWIAADLWFFLRDLKQGCTLKQAVEQIQSQFPNFDLAQALGFVFQNPFIHQIHFPENGYANSNRNVS